ncbi:hypothetical protein ACVBEQ_07000 [Nakamurella sp. GG22]
MPAVKIARAGRSAGVSLALGIHELSAKMLDTIPGAGDLKVKLPDAAWQNVRGDWLSAHRDPDDAPDPDGVVPRGRGL